MLSSAYSTLFSAYSIDDRVEIIATYNVQGSIAN